MKRRIYFITASILQIIIAIYIIATAENIVQNEIIQYKELYEIYQVEYIKEMIGVVEAKGVNAIIACTSISILINIWVLIVAIKNQILRNKGGLIAASIVCFLLSGNSLISLICVISFIILLCSKRVKPEDFPVKKEIPKLESIPLTIREKIIGIAIALIYFSQFVWKRYIPDDLVAVIIIQVVFYLTLFILAIAFWWKSIKIDLKTFKDNFGTYIKFILPRLGIMYILCFLTNIIAISVTNQITSVNQQTLEALPSWFVIPMAILWAPVLEETIFRGLIRKIIKNKTLFVIVSSICFGLMHTIGAEISLINTVVMSLSYAVIGGLLSYVYVKTDNISTSMFSHALINTFASIVTLL